HPSGMSLAPIAHLDGSIDVIAEDAQGRVVLLILHTTSDGVADLTAESPLMLRYLVEGQHAQALLGAETLGFHAAAVTFDFIGKPHVRPHKATPEALRKYTQPMTRECPYCAAAPALLRGALPPPHRMIVFDGKPAPWVDGGLIPVEGTVLCSGGEVVVERGRLHANQREDDETPADFRARAVAELSSIIAA